MNVADFSTALDQLYLILGNSLYSSEKFHVKNCYINTSLISKYIHMTIDISGSTMEFVISYDGFYKVPVLHYRKNGRVECIHEYAQLDVHPILQSPYAMLHPCETDAFMRSTQLEGLHYLVFWLNMQMTTLKLGLQLRQSPK